MQNISVHGNARRRARSEECTRPTNLYSASKRQALQKDHLKYPKLHLAAEEGDVSVVTELIKQGCDLDDVISAGLKRDSTALHLATEFRRTDVVKVLLENGADFTLEDANNCTPLHIACEQYSKKIIELIFTAFCVACTKLNEEIKNMFVSKQIPTHPDFNFNERFLKNFKPLHFAIKFQLTEIIIILLKSAVIDVEARDRHGITALHCFLQEFSKCKVMNANVLERYVEIGPVAMCPSRWDQVADRIIRLFVARCKGTKNPADNNGIMPIFYLYKSFVCRKKLCRDLSNHKIRAATGWARVNIISRLLRAPALSVDLHVPNCEGDTILHTMANTLHPRTCNRSQTEAQLIVKRYLASGGDIDAINHAGYTALHYSSLRCNTEVASVLLNFGANINASNPAGDTPYSIVRSSKSVHHKVSRFFFSHLKRLVILDPASLNTATKELYERDDLELLMTDVQPNVSEEAQCRAELEKMKTDYIDDFTNVYDILRKSVHDLIFHTRNEKVINRDFRVPFPIYGFLVANKLNSAKKRAILVESAKELLVTIVPFNLPDACLHGILSPLGMDDLKFLIKDQ